MPHPLPFARLFRLTAAGLLAAGLGGCVTLGLEEGEKTLANMPANLSVDPYLWQGALDALNFLPIASQDPAAGKIETGWGPGQSAGEQVRASVQIFPGPVSASSVAVKVYRQVNGQPAAVNPQAAITVQDAILLRARQIKTAIQDDE